MRAHRSSRHLQRVVDRRDVVHAEDPGAALVGDDVGGDRGRDPILHRPGGDLAQERLARGADHHRAPERDELVEAAQQLEVVRDRLAEADPGIEQDPLLGRCRPRPATSSRSLQEGGDLRDDIAVARVALHRARRRPACASGSRSAPAWRPRAAISASPRSAVTSLTRRRAGVQRRARRPAPWRCRSTAAREQPPSRSPSITADHPAQLLVAGDRLGAGAGRLAADVEDRRPRALEGEAVGDRRRRGRGTGRRRRTSPGSR